MLSMFPKHKDSHLPHQAISTLRNASTQHHCPARSSQRPCCPVPPVTVGIAGGVLWRHKWRWSLRYKMFVRHLCPRKKAEAEKAVEQQQCPEKPCLPSGKALDRELPLSVLYGAKCV